MAKRDDILNYVDQLLQVSNYADYCPNGLQVEGKSEIKIIVSGVTACQALLDKAIEHEADAIFVHHGYFWKNESLPVTGMKRRRLATLLQHNINLLAYHLPLDAHSIYGNNVQLAKQLDIHVDGPLSTAGDAAFIFIGHLAQPLVPSAFASLIAERMQRKPLLIMHDSPRPSSAEISKIAWCTGAAQNFIQHVLHTDVDVYLTGEASEQTTHIAREMGIHFVAAGHHATERYGVMALAEHLAEKFSLTHYFIDIDNPV